MKRFTLRGALVVAALLAPSAVQAGEVKAFKQPIPPEVDSWQLRLSLPVWLAGIEGDVGINGNISHVDVDPGDIIRRLDMVATLRAEASKGPFGVIADFAYSSASDGIGTKKALKKIDIQLDSLLADIGWRWRLIDTPRCSLDVIGGVRYTNIYEKMALQPNDERIGVLAEELARAGTLIRARLAEELVALSGRDPLLPIGPLAGNEAERIARAIERIRGNAAERREQIEQLLHNALNRKLTRLDDWFDPYIGLRGRCNFTDRCYFSVKGDVGGFGVGSDFTWQVEGLLGYQLTPRVYTEAGYRALGVDYDHDGFIYDVITHGAELLVGISF